MKKYLLLLLMLPGLAFAATYKCQGADGKMEFMDRPCDTTKKSIEPPKSTAISQITPMQKLEELFTQYETPLCERETLMTQIDVARRNQDAKKVPDVWKKKQERLDELNDTQIEFRTKATKLTQINGIDGVEANALLKFQSKVRACAKLATANSASASASDIPAAASATAPAAPAKK